MQFVVQISPEDCTGCACARTVCPAKNKSNPQLKALNLRRRSGPQQERENGNFFLSLPEFDRAKVKRNLVRDVQLLKPLFEFSAPAPAAARRRTSSSFPALRRPHGRGQRHGLHVHQRRPTCRPRPGQGLLGRGPAWSNSLFEDAAEFASVTACSFDKQNEMACELLRSMEGQIGGELVGALINAVQKDEAGIAEQRARVETLKKKLAGIKTPEARQLLSLADMLVQEIRLDHRRRRLGLRHRLRRFDHVIASGRNVNLLVLDTEVYSNTGGQMSKSTPPRRGGQVRERAQADAQKRPRAHQRWPTAMCMWPAFSLGARDDQVLKRPWSRADSYDGPSIIIATATASRTASSDNRASGTEAPSLRLLPLYRFNPELAAEGKIPSSSTASRRKSISRIRLPAEPLQDADQEQAEEAKR
jgi:pyruvate-ferredoxin/flavodoxin oxidoreductase